MVDNIKLSYKEPLIMNTDISSDPGIHWIVLHLVNKICLKIILDHRQNNDWQIQQSQFIN